MNAFDARMNSLFPAAAIVRPPVYSLNVSFFFALTFLALTEPRLNAISKKHRISGSIVVRTSLPTKYGIVLRALLFAAHAVARP